MQVRSSAAPDQTLACRICQTTSVFVGQKQGNQVKGPFDIYRCPSCGFVFVGEPCTDYAALYSDAYYRGEGADPLVDYELEMAHPEETIRKYEWRGILRVVRALKGDAMRSGACRWLDYGCGNGGLVRYVRGERAAEIVGFDEGAMAEEARSIGLPILDQKGLDVARGGFDVVTAVEVLEHLVDPVAAVARIRGLLKPGGLFFYTTGNAEPFQRDILAWPYLIPDIHVGVFQPRTLRKLFAQGGFRTEQRGFVPGYEDILRFKILKNLRVRRVAAWQHALPWAGLTRLADARYKVTAHPIAWAG